MNKIPWGREEYIALDPSDLDPSPPTPERRIRVAAAIATYMRDASLLNVEVIRAILTMDDAAWARDIGAVRSVSMAYDPVDPKVRFEQVRAARGA